MNGDLGRAAALYGQFVARHPQTMDCRIGLARVEARQGLLGDAKRRILDVLKESPNNVDSLLVAGLVYWREGDLEQAKRYLKKGAGLSLGYADYHFILGRIEESQGHVAEALMRYDRALELQPDYADAARQRLALGRRRR